MTEKEECILIVDDIEDVRESLALILEDEGYSTVQAANGLEAIELMTAGQIDMVITDIMMPKMDGLELSTEVQNKFPKIKIILISGGGRQMQHGNEWDILNQTKKLTGIENVLKKPFKPEEMISLVNQLFDH